MNVGDVVEIRGRLYEVVGFRDDNEPILRRLPNAIIRMPGGGLWAER